MRRLRPVLADALLVLLLLAVSFVALLVHNDQCGCDRLPAGAVGTLIVSLAPLALHRRWPVGTYFIAGFATAIYGAQPYPDPPIFFGPLLGLDTVASLRPRRISLLIVLVFAGFAAGEVVVLKQLGLAWRWPSWWTPPSCARCSSPPPCGSSASGTGGRPSRCAASTTGSGWRSGRPSS